SKLDDKVVFGAALYAQPLAATTCPSLTSVARSLHSTRAIADLMAANFPDGNTPTGEAIDAAVDSFTRAPRAGTRPAIVLATDGEPDTCTSGTDETAGRAASVAAAQRAARAGIPL